VGAVSYLNTKPLLYGIQRSPVMDDIKLVIDYPARIADMLLKDEIDMGLVPVAIIPKMKQFYLNGNYCIGSDGPVASVCLFSENPIESIKTILLDYQSRTSVQLARILLKEYWKISPNLENAGADFRNQIRDATAGVVIGDRALEQRTISPFSYDLGEAWKSLTGLPFVFAAWISNKPMDESFVRKFDDANRLGIQQVDAVVAENPYHFFNLHEYFTQYLNYHLGKEQRTGLEKFLQYLQAQ
jgi:chorismate dehydratase